MNKTSTKNYPGLNARKRFIQKSSCLLCKKKKKRKEQKTTPSSSQGEITRKRAQPKKLYPAHYALESTSGNRYDKNAFNVQG